MTKIFYQTEGLRTVLLGSLGCWLHDSAVVLGDEVDHDGRALPRRTSSETRAVLKATKGPRNLCTSSNFFLNEDCRDGRIPSIKRESDAAHEAEKLLIMGMMRMMMVVMFQST